VLGLLVTSNAFSASNIGAIYLNPCSGYYMLNKTIMKNIRIPLLLLYLQPYFWLQHLASLISLSVLQQHVVAFYVYGQTQGIAGEQQHQITNAASPSNMLSLSTLTSQGSPYQGTKSAPVTVIDFSDFQFHLCARYVKNTEPMINKTYIQTGKVALGL
jgi:thioredoxin family protein